ncbi:hypothetical protein ACH35V_40500 [Actinomadura sp. 1N219]|uniref:hypothetical protein n=1 Tax=Actinomadura sp. 1N219 TaxID=3375152 RepID=UPI00378BF8B0
MAPIEKVRDNLPFPPADATAGAAGLDLRARRLGVEDLGDLDAAGREIVPHGLDVGDDQVEAVAEPGAATVMVVPNWKPRTPLSKAKSASNLQPSIA